MLTTLFTDASWCPDTRAGGWGAWARNERMTKGALGSGAFRSLLLGSNEAEVLAAANGLAWCLLEKYVLPGERVLFQLDSQTALRVIWGAQIGCRLNGTVPEEGWRFLREKREELGLEYSVKHVKGHSSEEGTRSSVNRRVDGLARAGMLKMRDHLQAGGTPTTFLARG